MTDTQPSSVVDLARRRRQDTGPDAPWMSADRVLYEVATMLNSASDLRTTLHRLAEFARATSGADRASIFLLDDHELAPAVALGRIADGDLWAAFRAMGPIDVRRLPAAYDHLRQGHVVAVEDARDSEAVPHSWAERFGVGAAVLVPLFAIDAPCGVLAVDYPEPRAFAPDLLERLEALGAAAGAAVRKARTYDATARQARVNDALAKGAGALIARRDATGVATTLVDAYTDLLRPRLCLIGLFDHRAERITTLAGCSDRPPDASVPFSRVPRHIFDDLTGTWQRSLEPVRFDADPWFADLARVDPEGLVEHRVLPIAEEERVLGAVVLGFDRQVRLEPEERDATVALAAFAAIALQRTRMFARLQDDVSHLEALHEVSTALAEGVDADALTSRLNRVLAGRGIEVTGMALRDRRLARHLAGDRLTQDDRDAIRDGQQRPGADGVVIVPMRLGRRRVGVIRVRAEGLDAEGWSFADAVAAGVAEVASRGALRAALEQEAHARDVAAERDRMAADLHDSVGQLLTAMGLLADKWRLEVPADSPWSGRLRRLLQLADGGQWEIDQAVRALAHVPARGALAGSLRDLARSFEADSGIHVIVDVRGGTDELAATAERVLYRVSHSALTNAWRHARCAVVRIELDATGDPITLKVRDDGVGLGNRSGNSIAGLGIASMRRNVGEVEGGTLRIANASPHGALVEAILPRHPPSGNDEL